MQFKVFLNNAIWKYKTGIIQVCILAEEYISNY